MPEVPDWPFSTFPDSPEGVALAIFFWIVTAEKSLHIALGQPPREYAIDLLRQCLSTIRGNRPQMTLEELIEERLH